MRTLWNAYLAAGEEDLRFFSVCLQGSSESSVTSYVEYDLSGEDPPPSTWPVFVDDTEAKVAVKECATGYTAMIVDSNDVVVYHQTTQFTNADQKAVFLESLDLALGQ